MAAFPVSESGKGTGSEQGGVNITPPDEATYMHVLYKDHGSLKNISFERDAVGDPWRSLENKPLLNGVTYPPLSAQAAVTVTALLLKAIVTLAHHHKMKRKFHLVVIAKWLKGKMQAIPCV